MILADRLRQSTAARHAPITLGAEGAGGYAPAAPGSPAGAEQRAEGCRWRRQQLPLPGGGCNVAPASGRRPLLRLPLPPVRSAGSATCALAANDIVNELHQARRPLTPVRALLLAAGIGSRPRH